MKNSPSSDRKKAPTSPQDSPAVTTPLNYDSHSFILQAIMESQKTLGKLDANIDALKAQLETQGKKISTHGTTLAVCAGGMAVLIAIGGFAIKQAWPQVAALMTMNVAGADIKTTGAKH